VLPATADRAPAFFSAPLVSATAVTAYSYPPDVRDPNGEAAAVTLAGPAGASYSSGRVV
jgi:hypothetical protein